MMCGCFWLIEIWLVMLTRWKRHASTIKLSQASPVSSTKGKRRRPIHLQWMGSLSFVAGRVVKGFWKVSDCFDRFYIKIFERFWNSSNGFCNRVLKVLNGFWKVLNSFDRFYKRVLKGFKCFEYLITYLRIHIYTCYTC